MSNNLVAELVKAHAWNWVWPNERNEFPIPARHRGPSHLAGENTVKGKPGRARRRTLAKRSARQTRARK